jgi:hypothetical protein
MLKNKAYIFISIFLGFFCLTYAQDNFTYQLKGKRNPFIPLVDKSGMLMKLDKEEEKGQSELSIDGIIYDKQGVSYALVNGRVVGTGDYAGEYRVLKIQDDKVSFLKDDQIKEVSINKGGDN